MKGLRVLIVDDDRDFGESLADILKLDGHDVELACSGEEAVEKFRETDFDIGFMDVRLPGMNGVESFLEIRRIRPDARVAIMTGYSVEQLLDRAVANGAWGILHKPLDLDEVLDMLGQIGAARP